MKKFFKSNNNYDNRGPPGRQRPAPFAGYDPGKVNNSVALYDSFNHMTVKARPGENPEYLLKRFKRMCEDANILGELKKREFHRSRGQMEREKQQKAIKRARKAAAKNAWRDED